MYLMERHVLDVTISPPAKKGKIRVVISASDWLLQASLDAWPCRYS
jgi:hypothetical protein